MPASDPNDSGACDKPRVDRSGDRARFSRDDVPEASQISSEVPGADGGAGEWAASAGDAIGPFVLRSRIGEGSFGSVWLAERLRPYQEKVAVKLLKPGMDSAAVLGRFEIERQTLAVMNHPGIARILDGGMTPRGRPYFAMEYVGGVPITEFCDAERVGIRERLTLVAEVCDAVQHAHTKGVIHRDLTPSNILAAWSTGRNPTVKIIDFGIAKALTVAPDARTAETLPGDLLGTPEYMSPEQAAGCIGGIDTRTDVYAIGVVLYELLCGERPLVFPSPRRAHLQEIRRMIIEDPPSLPATRFARIVKGDPRAAEAISSSRSSAPSELQRQLQGELAWILMKALRKSPDERYGSCADFARDIRRYLSNLPIEAAPESRWYRLQSLLRRRRRLVVASGAFAAVLISVIVVGVAWLVERATASNIMQAAPGSVTALMQYSDPYTQSTHEERINQLAAIAHESISPIWDVPDWLGSALADQPAQIKLGFESLVGALEANEGFLDAARVRFESVLQEKRTKLANDPLTIAATEDNLACVLARLARRERDPQRATELFDLAESHYQVSLQLRASAGGGRAKAASLRNLAGLRALRADTIEQTSDEFRLDAIRLYIEAIAVLDGVAANPDGAGADRDGQAFGDVRQSQADVRAGLSQVLLRRKDCAQALMRLSEEASYRRALLADLSSRTRAPSVELHMKHVKLSLAGCCLRLAAALDCVGDREAQAKARAEGMRLQREVLGEGYPFAPADWGTEQGT
jgi:serine/threonine protein kinase